jgi:hypothetical protein
VLAGAARASAHRRHPPTPPADRWRSLRLVTLGIVTTLGKVRALLSTSSVPVDFADELLQEASPWWLGSASAQGLVDDLALCYPPLAGQEVRARARPTLDSNVYRLTVVAQSQPGLLTALAATLAVEGLLIVKAVATSWTEGRLTLIGLDVMHPDGRLQPLEWDRVSDTVQRTAVAGSVPEVAFRPRPPVTVDAFPRDKQRVLLEVRAPHRIGLLWAICSWLTEHECSVDAAFVEAAGDIRQSFFIVTGVVDADAIRAHLAGRPMWQSPTSLLASAQRWVRRRLRLP